METEEDYRAVAERAARLAEKYGAPEASQAFRKNHDEDLWGNLIILKKEIGREKLVDMLLELDDPVYAKMATCTVAKPIDDRDNDRLTTLAKKVHRMP